MRTPTLLFFLAVFGHAFAQWSITSAPSGARKDDLFFIGADTGWVACGGDGNILRTYNGGASWQMVYSGAAYLRSIEFATPQVGFCGTLNGGFLKTTDGGNTWHDIANLMPPPVYVCGLCAATPDVIFGVGVYHGPAYVVRSRDGGDTWTKTDLSSLASGLVDVYFLNADTGFIAGIALPPARDGIILATTDGGDTWTERHRTGKLWDIVWKLQSPDGTHLYASLDASPGPTRYLRSADRGATWVTDTISMDYTYVQVIGFLDTLHGWMGADGTLLETVDGGGTWNEIPLGNSYDRFHRVNSSLAYMTGLGVYRYGDTSTGVSTPIAPQEREHVEVVPNPATASASIQVELLGRSRAQLVLFAADGRWSRTVYTGTVDAGAHTFPLDLTDLPAGTYYATLRTNQGLTCTPFVKQ
ncbi:MAG TPA: hypothetical protein VHL57_02445 [Flavobacteriales bacterium]|jgi:photosystem II stability/assembly factor-like uncharacterized protein|nr:hypothetical protein [Flavobacteriales bacterium]